jgi:hypothetical protein
MEVVLLRIKERRQQSDYEEDTAQWGLGGGVIKAAAASEGVRHRNRHWWKTEWWNDQHRVFC